MQATGNVKIKKSVNIGGRQFNVGIGYEVSPEEAGKLFKLRAAVPCGERGGILTATHTARDMNISEARNSK